MHLGRKYILAVIVAVLFPLFLGAETFDGKSFLRQLQKRDSVLVADQLVYGFRIDGVEDGTQLECPDFTKDFTEGVMALTGWKLDTLKTHRAKKGNPKRYDIEGGIVLTSFVEGEYVLDTIRVMTSRNGEVLDSLLFEPSLMDVKTMPVDTASFKPHDIKEQIRYPLTVVEVLPWVAGIQILGMIAIIIYALMAMHRRKNDPEFVKKEPAHIVALRRLDKLRGDKMWAADKQKVFYSGITDALREYISSRYGIGAVEMTTAEIFKDMKATDAPEALLNEVKELFERADYVKFAKYVASEDENSSALPLAVRFVTETYQAEIETENDKK